jgi:uncharacterized protein (TIGR03382 family)
MQATKTQTQKVRRLDLGSTLNVLAALATLAVWPAPAGARTVTTRIDLLAGTARATPLDREGFSQSRIPGRPALPQREVTVALHPGADLSTLVVRILPGAVDTVPGRHALAPNPPLTLFDGRRARPSYAGAGTIVDGRDVAAFGGSPFPREALERLRVTDRRGMLVLHLRHSPLRYRHSTGELLLHRHLAATVSYRLRDEKAFEPDALLAPHLEGLENADEARRWYSLNRLDTTAPLGYAIVVPDRIAKKSQKLSAFVAHKKALGFTVTTVGDAELSKIIIKRGGDPERLRAYLVQNYKKLKLKYVLLIGNPDPNRSGVPMKESAVMEDNNGVGDTTPTDHYYSSLKGDWDLNKDGRFAVYPDDDGTGGVDLTPDVYVGRIPVYDDDVTALDSILQKTIKYATETGDRSWRGRVLIPAAMLFFKNEGHELNYRMDGADIAEGIIKEALAKSPFTVKRLYEATGVDHTKDSYDLPLTRANVIAEWKKGYGLVDWIGHGSEEGAYRLIWDADTDGDGVPDWDEIDQPTFFTYDDTVSLDDTKPAIVFHGSCSNGTPEVPTNLAYGLLRHGAVATIAASRVAIVLLSQAGAAKANIFGVESDFTLELARKKSVGEALFASKENISSDYGEYSWYAKLEINLYGDPSITLASCTKDSDCDDKRRCNGKESCVAGQCVSGSPLVCFSADPCTAVTCDEAGGCTSAPRPEGESCDDGRFCTTEDKCVSGACTGTPVCATPGNGCVSSTCDESSRTCRVDSASFEGQSCRGGTDREGVCAEGVCEPTSSTGCSAAPASPPPAAAVVVVLALAPIVLVRRRRGSR